MIFKVQLSAYHLHGHLSHVDTTSLPTENLAFIQHCFQYVSWAQPPLTSCTSQMDTLTTVC